MPRERDFFRVAHLVLGGLAVRLDLTFENLEDLQLAFAELLRENGADITVAVEVEDDRFTAAIGPFDGKALQAELDGELEGALGLRRVLTTVCDRFELVDRDGGRWVEIEKKVGTRREPDA
ncbi:MAG: hypothetical protein QOE36_852 [Gaiellaceae bacterium]|nr:hypothetical protein [Gaiellaceae bacterium]